MDIQYMMDEYLHLDEYFCLQVGQKFKGKITGRIYEILEINDKEVLTIDSEGTHRNEDLRVYQSKYFYFIQKKENK